MVHSEDHERVRGKMRTTCSTAGPLQVSVRDGKMIRVEPLQFDSAEVDSWQCDVNGKTYKPPLTHPLLPWGMIGKQMAYSENRVMYPMKRVDWDPKGERNTQNRGSSGYERISWDEAFNIIESEMKRVIETYGNSALSEFYSAHPEWGFLHYFFSDWVRFWDMIGSTHIDFSPNSWEGWSAGSTLMWGHWPAQGIPAAPDTFFDVSEHDDLIVLWGVDPMFHNLYGGVDQARLWRWWKELGKEVVVIEPLYNEVALAVADRWIPIYPGTDGAMAEAIAYVWITEGTFEQEYLDTHCIGFDEDHLPEGVPAGLSFKTHILGKGSDKTPKTPEWAAEKCGVPARIIRRLAREWAARPTSFWVFTGGACRRQFAEGFTRLAATLGMMRAMGKPGSNMIGPFLSLSGPFDDVNQIGPGGYADGGMNSVCKDYRNNSVPQRLTFQKLLKSVEEDEFEYFGGDLFNTSAEEYFNVRKYPTDGCSPIRLFWQRGSSCTNPPDRNQHLKFLRSPQIEAFFVSAPWFDRECRMADLVLPTTTMYEREDFTEPARCGKYIPPSYVGLRSAIYHQRCIEPIGESMTDMDILAEVADRFGLKDVYLEGNSEEDFIRKIYANTNIPLSFEEIQKKGYYVWPAPKDYKPNKQFNDFYHDPENNPMPTPTGKVEIFSTLAWEKYGDHPEIPPYPKYIPELEGAESTELKEKYPLQQLLAHPKFRFHGKYNDCTWLNEAYKVKGPDGYKYEPVLIHPDDAADRGLKDNDIVVVYNDRGTALGGAVVTYRMKKGVAQFTYGAWNDPLDGGFGAPDRGGDGQVLTNPSPMSAHHPTGGAYNSSLIEIKKADLDQLAKDYPEGWSGKYRTWNKEG
ncbi:MAG: molybdopterin-dependent oxidoreductase [Eggerthellaceae bacterium]|nr:molybdopterin-dependent oxidoreductase [Eggerthellaceae bacterium]